MYTLMMYDLSMCLHIYIYIYINFLESFWVDIREVMKNDQMMLNIHVCVRVSVSVCVCV